MSGNLSFSLCNISHHARSKVVKSPVLTRTVPVVAPLKPLRIEIVKRKKSEKQKEKKGIVVTPRSRELVLSLTGLAESGNSEKNTAGPLPSTPRSAEIALMLAGGIGTQPEQTSSTRKKKSKKKTVKKNSTADKGKLQKKRKKQIVQKRGLIWKGPRAWSSSEDKLLTTAVEKYGAKNWKQIAMHVPDRNDCQCLQRYKKVLKPGLVRGAWNFEEDKKLKEILYKKMKEIGRTEEEMVRPTPVRGKWVTNWQEIADQLEGRTSKQCRERWCNHLDPSIKRGNWTPKEDKLIKSKYNEIGSKWSAISRMLPGRTENAVKIRFKSLERSAARKGKLES